MPAPYQGTGISILRSYGRRFNAIDVSIDSVSGSRLAGSAKRKPRRSKPPPDFPTRYSVPFTGGPPASAWIQGAGIRSADHLASPRARGVTPHLGQPRNP